MPSFCLTYIFGKAVTTQIHHQGAAGDNNLCFIQQIKEGKKNEGRRKNTVENEAYAVVSEMAFVRQENKILLHGTKYSA